MQAGEVSSYVQVGASQLKADIRSKIDNQMVVNDLDRIVACWPPKDSPRTLVLVMDNTPPEMFADLVLSEFLLSTGLIERVVFMPKRIPWFVSDVTPRDFEWLLKETLPGPPEHLAKIRPWLESWSQRFCDGSFVTELHGFWTLPVGYNAMQSRAPNLYHRLTNGCSVVIFKVI